MSRPATEVLLDQVKEGYRSVRNAASELGWTVDEVCMEVWGELWL